MNRLMPLCSLFAVALLPLTAWAGIDYELIESDDKGNGNAKGGYIVRAQMKHCGTSDPSDCTSNAYSQYYQRIAGKAEAWVKLFGTKKTMGLGKVRAEDIDGVTTYYAYLEAKGDVLFSAEGDSLDVERSVSFERSESFSLLGLSVSVSGEAFAGIGVTLEGGIDLSNFDEGSVSLTVTGTPFINAGVEASASIGVACASASISGELKAIKAELPTTGGLAIDSGSVDYKLKSKLEYRLLSGCMEVSLSYCASSDSATIASFSSPKKTLQLFDINGSF